MKIYKLLNRIAILSLVILCYSCAEDKYYDLGGFSVGKVNFTAVNLNVGEEDSASSAINDNTYYYPERNVSFTLPIYYFKGYDYGELESEKITYTLDKESEIWAGGYNDIKITFQPTVPEETEATFTLPDGSVVTATTASPTFIWHTDSLIGSYSRDLFIKAESKYRKGSVEYVNVGYISMAVSDDIRFNRFNDKWYRYGWISGNPMETVTYTKFTAENLIIPGDSATSCNYNFPNTLDYETKDFSLPYYVYDDEDPLLFTFSKGGNDIYAVGNQKILFTFHPQEGEKSMTLSLPTGENITLTDSEPTYTWEFGLSEAEIVYYRDNTITAYSEYYHEGIYYTGQSEMKVNTTQRVVYNPTNDRYYRYD